MLESLLAGALGYVVNKAVSGLGTATHSTEKKENENNFNEMFEKAVAGNAKGTTPAAIVSAMSASMKGVLDSISSSYNIEDRRSTALLYRQSVIDALQGGGYSVSEHEDPDKIILDGKTIDILSSLNTPGARVRSQFLEINGSGGAGTASGGGNALSAKQVVFDVAREHQDLLTKANAATSVDEKLGYIDELKNLTIDALNESGHDAWDYGKSDKIVIDGRIYDIYFAAKGLGADTRVQWLPLKTAAEKGLTPPAGHSAGTASVPDHAAIFSAAAHGMSLLSQISSSFDVQERRELGMQFQNTVIEELNAKGYSASAHEDPDKIVLNGTTYDIIRSLNSPGAHAHLQALRV